MPFDRPTLEEIDTRVQNDMKSRIQNAFSLLRRSLAKIFARVFAGSIHLLYGFLEYQKDQLFVLTANTDNLETQGNEYGVVKTETEKATGTGAGTGTYLAVIPAKTELESSAGYTYLTDEEVSVGATGTFSVDFTAKDAGSEYNDDSGILLSFISPIAGVDTKITVGVAGIDGGTEEEEDESYRSRVLTRKRTPPHGGAEFDYASWTLEISGNTRVWVFPQYQGRGTIGVAYVRDNDASIIPSTDEMESTKEYLIEHIDPTTGLTIGVPVGAKAGLHMVVLSLYAVDFDISISPNNSAVRTQVTAQLEDYLLNFGGPGETQYYSDISAAVGSAASLTVHKLNVPDDDIAIPINRVPVFGEITWRNYG